MQRSNKFKGSKVAKLARKYLKKLKKENLVNTTYKGISFQLKLSQLRYLINMKYEKKEDISIDAWLELVLDLVGENESLIEQLFNEVIHFNRDAVLGIYLSSKYGHEYIQKLGQSTRDFYYENSLNIIR